VPKTVGLGAVHKRRPQSGGGGYLSSADVLRTRGEVWTSALFGAKKLRTFLTYVVSVWTRGKGVEPVRTFFGKGRRGQLFVILCRRLLRTD